MKPVVVIAFYIWLALTVAIVLGRLARWTAARQASKRRRQARALARQQAEAMAVATPVSAIDLTETEPETEPEIETATAAAAAAAAAEATAAEERRAEERRAAERRVGDRRNGDRRAGQPVPAAAASVAAPAPVTVPATASGPTIPQLLSGIAIPNDLVPIVAAGTDNSDQSTALISRDRPAYEVGTGIADELERLGYQLTPVGEATLLAKRGDDVLTVEIDPTPNQPDPNGTVRFPTANPNDVVVEFWVGSGPRPV